MFTDSHSSRNSAIRGGSGCLTMNLLIRAFDMSDISALYWLERVASHGNIADEPSTGDCKLALRLMQAINVEVFEDLPELKELLDNPPRKE